MKQATMLVHCSACDAHRQITGNTTYYHYLMIVPSQIIAFTGNWHCVKHSTSNAYIRRKGKDWYSYMFSLCTCHLSIKDCVMYKSARRDGLFQGPCWHNSLFRTYQPDSYVAIDYVQVKRSCPSPFQYSIPVVHSTIPLH